MKKGLERIREIERQDSANYRKYCEEQFLRRHLYTRQRSTSSAAKRTLPRSAG